MILLLLFIFFVCTQFSSTQAYFVLPDLLDRVTIYKQPITNQSAIEISLLFNKNISSTGFAKFQQPALLQDKNTFALKSPLLKFATVA